MNEGVYTREEEHGVVGEEEGVVEEPRRSLPVHARCEVCGVLGLWPRCAPSAGACGGRRSVRPVCCPGGEARWGRGDPDGEVREVGHRQVWLLWRVHHHGGDGDPRLVQVRGHHRRPGHRDRDGKVGPWKEPLRLAAQMGGTVKWPYNESECLDADFFKV